ncbi:MAG: hypothetical protein QNK40_02665 [Desulfobacterales bacterium]|nr:hypothetical protein [Desulfobacterales bacterium]MDX2508313.1 hypothetical protein [Desulfobacterales bacterium]
MKNNNLKRPLKNGNLCLSSKKAKISTTGIYGIFRGLKFEPAAEIGHKVPFCKGRLNFPLAADLSKGIL